MRRTEPKSVGVLFDELFNSPHIAAKIAEGCLPDTWREVVGDRIADQTSQIRLVNGTLYVHVQSSIIRTELMMRRAGLCQAINANSRVPIVRSVIVK
jgi:predicted nucleic acid-binding Zn ribbon protein